MAAPGAKAAASVAVGASHRTGDNSAQPDSSGTFSPHGRLITIRARFRASWGNLVTEQELVSRAGKGDERAFELLIRKYQHRIFALINRYVRDQDEVLDVAQEAFLKAWRALPRFRGDSQFYTWLYRIAVNTAKNHLVSMGRRPPSSDIDADEAEQFVGADGLHETGTP